MSGPSSRINGADVTNRPWADKSREWPDSDIRPPFRQAIYPAFSLLARARLSRQHLLDLDCDPVAIDQHHAGGDGQAVGEDLDLVGLGGIQLDDGTARETQDLMDGHGRGTENDHQIDGNFIEGCHF